MLRSHKWCRGAEGGLLQQAPECAGQATRERSESTDGRGGGGGGFNAVIGADNSKYEHVMGKHGLGRLDENGDFLADFCPFNNMVIGGSNFPHKNIHKVIWRFT